MCGDALKWAHSLQGLKLAEKALLVQLAYLVKPGCKLIATYEQLATRLGVSKSSVCRYLKLLEQRRLIFRRRLDERGKYHMNEIVVQYRNQLPVPPKKRTSKSRGIPRQNEAPSIEDKYTPYSPQHRECEFLDYFEDPELWVICHGVLNGGANAEAAAASAMIAPIFPFKDSIVAGARAELKRQR